MVDGFNLYHSLREIEKETGNKVRWLDLRALCLRIVRRLFPADTCPYPCVLLFTAHRVYEDAGHQKRQLEYYQCLKRLGVKVVDDGEWASRTIDLRRHFKAAPWFIRYYLVRRFGTFQTHQEKGTDVSIAAHLMHLGRAARWVCIVSGDADLIPALDLFRATSPGVKLGVARPFGRGNRKLNHLNCTDLMVEDCVACQLPNPAPSKKRLIYRPPHW